MFSFHGTCGQELLIFERLRTQSCKRSATIHRFSRFYSKMTIFTSSSARRTTWIFLAIAALVALLTTAVLTMRKTAPSDRRQTTSGEAAVDRTVEDVAVEEAAAAAQIAASLSRNGRELLSALYINFDLATREAGPRKSRMTAMPEDNSAGIACNPASLDRHTAALHIVLPANFAARNTALAALTPDGNLRIVYIAYGPDFESIDLLIPSRSIDWERARTRRDFVVEVDKFEALRPNQDAPERLFRQAGIYQFALINATNRENLATNGGIFQIMAGCVVHYQP